MPNKSNIHYFMDNDKEADSEISYFMSFHFNFLPFRYEDSFILEPYSPHRFSRQFRFYQSLPCSLANDIRSASLDKGLRFYHIRVLHGSIAKATFPMAIPNARKHSSTSYKSWWDKVHGNFLEANLQSLVNVVGSIIDTPQEHGKEVPIVAKPLVLTAKVVIPYIVKGPLPAETQKEEPPALTQSTFNKQPYQDESNSSHGNRCWKKVKPSLANQDNSNSHVEILASSSKTPSAIDKPNDVQILEDPHQSKPQDSSKSVAGPNSRKLLLSSKEVISNPCGKVKANIESNFSRLPAVTMSIFDGKKVISELKRKFIMKD